MRSISLALWYLLTDDRGIGNAVIRLLATAIASGALAQLQVSCRLIALTACLDRMP